MYTTIQALVLRVTAYNDTDALLTVLSRDQGKMTLKARGLRRKNSPLIAPCQLLAYGEFTLFEYKGMYSINEAHAIELFTALRKDLQKLALGTYFAQVAELISQEDLPNPELLSLVLNSLHALAKLDLPEAQVKAVFELRAACLAGYTPDLHHCSCCGNELPELFDLSGGHLICSRCALMEAGGIRMPISPGVLDAMRYICGCNSKKLFSFSINQETAESLSYITEGYLTSQLERGFSTLDFYKSLQNPLEHFDR